MHLFKGLGPTLKFGRKVSSWILFVPLLKSSPLLILGSAIPGSVIHLCPGHLAGSSVQMLLLRWIKVCWRMPTSSSHIKLVELPCRHGLLFQSVSCSITTFPSYFFIPSCGCVCLFQPSLRVWLISIILGIVGKWTLCPNLEPGSGLGSCSCVSALSPCLSLVSVSFAK